MRARCLRARTSSITTCMRPTKQRTQIVHSFAEPGVPRNGPHGPKKQRMWSGLSVMLQPAAQVHGADQLGRYGHLDVVHARRSARACSAAGQTALRKSAPKVPLA